MSARLTSAQVQAIIARATEHGAARLTAAQVQAIIARATEHGGARVTAAQVQAMIKRASEHGTARITSHLVQALTNAPQQIIVGSGSSITLGMSALGAASTLSFDRFADRTLLAGDFRIDWRVEIQDVSGTWIDVTGYALTASWGDSIDAPLATGQVVFVREVEGVTMAPLVAASALNTGAPLLDVRRGIRIWTATVALTATPAFPADYWLAIDGVIDDFDWAQQTIPVNFSDVRQRLIARSIRALKTYGGAVPVPMETVMAQIVADNGGLFALDCPTSPAFNLYTFTQSITPVLTALQTLAANIGWVVRPVRFSKTDFILQLFVPPRGKTTADWTLPPSEYLEVQQLAFQPGGIRNVVRVEYGASNFVEVGDADSIARYGEYFIVIGQEQTARISTGAQATALANSVLNDLRQPYATHTIRSLYLPFVYLYDLVALPANTLHYDSDQKFGVTGYQHVASGPGMITTSIATRGHIAGAYAQWFKSAGDFTAPVDTPANPTPPVTPPNPRIVSVSITNSGSFHTAGVLIVVWDGQDLPTGGSYKVVVDNSTAGSISATTYSTTALVQSIYVGAYTSFVAPPSSKFADTAQGRVQMLDASGAVLVTAEFPFNSFYTV